MRWILIILLIFPISCNNKDNGSEVTSQNDTSINFTILKKEIVENGDIESYKTLFIAYLDEPYPEEFLYYALIMANLIIPKLIMTSLIVYI